MAEPKPAREVIAEELRTRLAHHTRERDDYKERAEEARSYWQEYAASADRHADMAHEYEHLLAVLDEHVGGPGPCSDPQYPTTGLVAEGSDPDECGECGHHRDEHEAGS